MVVCMSRSKERNDIGKHLRHKGNKAPNVAPRNWQLEGSWVM